MWILLDNLEIPLNKIPSSASPLEIDNNLGPHIASFCEIPETMIREYRILRKSVDARKKRDLRLIFRLEVNTEESHRLARKYPAPALKTEHCLRKLEKSPSLPENPVVIGTGPAGLMVALLLAEYGLKPVVLERGGDVDSREKDIAEFMKKRKLNTESNYLFGEGGAGTYSDGKLYTRIKAPCNAYVLENFIEAGAPPQIAYTAHPHIGSDILPGMIKNLRKKIIALGGSFLWGKNAVAPFVENNVCKGILLDSGEKIEAPFVIAAPGLSARDFIKGLVQKVKLEYSLKPFQIGSRIEHSQSFINMMRFNSDPPHPALGAAAYNLVSRPRKGSGIKGATTFCMCPGGEIIPTTNYERQLSTNGMSRFSRDGDFANSAVIAEMEPFEFSSALEAFEFIDSLERLAFEAGGSDYSSPGQGAYAFVRGELDMPRKENSYRLGAIPARIDNILPRDIANALNEAFIHFEAITPGFMNSGTLIGIETHISSPVRFTRDPDTQESSLKRFYLAGEGAGFAGGIMSSALDGLKMAEAIITKGLK